MTPRERNEMPLEEFYSSIEENRKSLIKSIAATNRKINDRMIKDRSISPEDQKTDEQLVRIIKPDPIIASEKAKNLQINSDENNSLIRFPGTITVSDVL